MSSAPRLDDTPIVGNHGDSSSFSSMDDFLDSPWVRTSDGEADTGDETVLER